MSKSQSDTSLPAQSGRKSFLFLRRLLPWLVLIAVFVLIFSRIPVHEVMEEFRKMTPGQIAALAGLALVFVLGVCALDATALRFAFAAFQLRISWHELFLLRSATMVLVAVSSPVGQAGIAGHLVRTGRARLGEAAGMILFLMMIEFYGMLAVATVAFPFLLFFKGGSLSAQAPLLAGGIMIAGLWPLLFLLVPLGRSSAGAALLQRLRLESLVHPLHQLSFRQILVLLLLKTLLAAWQIALTFPAFRLYHLELPFLDLFAFMPLAIIVSSIPITPAKLGITQASWAFFFHYLFPLSALVAFSLLFQLLLNLARWLIGALALPFLSSRPARGESELSL